MGKATLKGLAAAGVTLGSLVAFSAGTFAATTPAQMFQANLGALNNSGTSGTATVEVNGNQATVKVTTTGASSNLPHAQHIHIGGTNVCATMADDANKDGVLTTNEGKKRYGDIKISLTTSGDVSAKSGLAIDRYPKATSKGAVTYSRTFALPSGVTAADLAKGVIVQHGVASLTGDKTKYDGNVKSDLDKNLSREATVPAACGKLTAAPAGGASTGGGSTAGTENMNMIIGGSVAAVAGASLIVLRKRFIRG